MSWTLEVKYIFGVGARVCAAFNILERVDHKSEMKWRGDCKETPRQLRFEFVETSPHPETKR